MALSKRIRRQQLIREAEGYLDLATDLSHRWPLEPALRDRLATRSMTTLDRLTDVGGDLALVLYLRGQALRAMERWGDAAAALRDAAELEPRNIHVWLALGWCYKRTGRLDLAIEALEAALEADPGEAIIHYNLACYWSLAKNKKHAIRYLGQALAIDPNYRDLIDGEPDFDPLRSDPEFQAMTEVIV